MSSFLDLLILFVWAWFSFIRLFALDGVFALDAGLKNECMVLDVFVLDVVCWIIRFLVSLLVEAAVVVVVVVVLEVDALFAKSDEIEGATGSAFQVLTK